MLRCLRFIGRMLRKLALRRPHPSPLVVSGTQAARFFRQYDRENEALVEAAATLLARAEVVFDIGANAGHFSRKILVSGYSGKIVLFEPVANLLSIAVQTVAFSSNEKIFINTALGEANGTIPLYLPHDANIGWITAVGEKAKSGKMVDVRLSDTTRYIQMFKPDFIKIDVEGYEIHILRPFLKSINDSYRPGFLIELGWGLSNPNWDEFISVAYGFIEKGYQFFSADSRQTQLDLVELKSLDKTTDVILRPG